MDELEEDDEMRQNINIFRDSTKQIPVERNEVDTGMPQVSLEEMLDDLAIDDADMIEIYEWAFLNFYCTPSRKIVVSKILINFLFS